MHTPPKLKPHRIFVFSQQLKGDVHSLSIVQVPGEKPSGEGKPPESPPGDEKSGNSLSIIGVLPLSSTAVSGSVEVSTDALSTGTLLSTFAATVSPVPLSVAGTSAAISCDSAQPQQRIATSGSTDRLIP